MRERILFVTPEDVSLDNGPGINEREFVRVLLDEFGDEVICAAPNGSPRGTFRDPRIEYLPRAPRRNPVRYARGLRAQYRRLLEIARREGVGIIAARPDFLPVVPRMVAQKLGLPLVLKTVAGYVLFDPEASRLRRVLASGIYPFHRRLVREAVSADTPSPTYAAWLERFYGVDPSRLVVVPNAANTNFFTPDGREESRRLLGLDRFEHVVGYVGALAAWRNTDLLLRGFRDLADGRSIGLVIVGDGPDRPRLEEMARDFGLEHNVHFAGQLPYARVPDYIRSFDVAIDLTLVRMKIGDAWHEASFSQKIPQYLACGTPTIAWRVEDNSFLEEADVGGLITSVERFADAASGLLRGGSEVLKARRARARAYAEEHLSFRNLARQRVVRWREIASAHGSR